MESGSWIETPEESTGFTSTLLFVRLISGAVGGIGQILFRSEGDPGVQALLIWTANLERTAIEGSDYLAIEIARRNQQSGVIRFRRSLLRNSSGEGRLGDRKLPVFQNITVASFEQVAVPASQILYV